MEGKNNYWTARNRFALQLILLLFISLTACSETTAKNKQMKKDTKLISDSNEPAPLVNETAIDTITLGGGCFWCVEAVYERLNGVVSVESGYSGGKVKNPTYNEVCTGLTGHAEVVQISYDTTKVTVDDILKVFFSIHDPTTLNRQGNDVGTQYRSVIFYRNDYQKNAASGIIEALDGEQIYDNPIVTQLVPFTKFYKAEDYHQEYYENNRNASYCRLVIQPKLEKFEKVFKERLKKQ
jgi:methionine-S-sulfoxide reductase